jgi:hypothetical protein
MAHFGEIPTMKLNQHLTEKELKQIKDMLKPNPEVEAKAKAMMAVVNEQAAEINKQFNDALEVEFKAVYDHAIANKIIKGKPSKGKFTKAGYDVCTQQGVGTYIRRNGERVSNIIP